MERSLRDPDGQPAVSGRRAEVLAHLRDAGRPLSVAEVADSAGLSPNTARFHLDGLVDDGLVERAPEERATPGRPRMLYSVRAAAGGPRSYALLAEMLTGLVASLPGAGSTARDAGRAWGRHLVERAAPSERIDADEALARLNRLLDAIGFAPETCPGQDGETEVRLHHCPFEEIARDHTDVVCAIHLGLMQGALDELGAPVRATALEPFVTPTRCVARLRADIGRRAS
ncbi:MAG TPA: helix-turn-helix domain-containing protein [Motilibacteraceae bacterium]|nr:helix-turn-helix domain-containing protein [Motilibacteraceae bacterium]